MSCSILLTLLGSRMRSWSLKFHRLIFQLVRVGPDQSAYFEEKGAGATARVSLRQKQEATVFVNKGSCRSFVRAGQHFLIKNKKKQKCISAFYGPVMHLKASQCSQLVGKKSNWPTLDVWQEANPFFFVLEKASSSQSFLLLLLFLSHALSRMEMCNKIPWICETFRSTSQLSTCGIAHLPPAAPQTKWVTSWKQKQQQTWFMGVSRRGLWYAWCGTSKPNGFQIFSGNHTLISSDFTLLE